MENELEEQEKSVFEMWRLGWCYNFQVKTSGRQLKIQDCWLGEGQDMTYEGKNQGSRTDFGENLNVETGEEPVTETQMTREG